MHTPSAVAGHHEKHTEICRWRIAVRRFWHVKKRNDSISGQQSNSEANMHHITWSIFMEDKVSHAHRCHEWKCRGCFWQSTVESTKRPWQNVFGCHTSCPVLLTIHYIVKTTRKQSGILPGVLGSCMGSIVILVFLCNFFHKVREYIKKICV